MIFEIRKSGFTNKGAELMLIAIREKIKKKYPNASLAIAPTLMKKHDNYIGYIKRAELGLLQKSNFYYRQRRIIDLLKFLPKNLRWMYGIVTDNDLDFVIDAAGFAYSDAWGIKHCIELASISRKLKRKNIKLILLPQAFGPFTSKKIKKCVNEIIKNADLICARDRQSFENLTNIYGDTNKIIISPDFTNLIEGFVPEYFDKNYHQYCIVPNYRMIDKTSSSLSNSYIPFMATCIRTLINQGKKPFFLIHEGRKDYELSEMICNELNFELSIINEDDPLKVKGIIGACEGMIGSRYHGLVSALSQGVPALSTSWSHKYQKLFDDYNFPDGVLSLTIPESEIKKKIELITNITSREKIISELVEKSVELKNEVENMWEEVFKLINSTKQ